MTAASWSGDAALRIPATISLSTIDQGHLIDCPRASVPGRCAWCAATLAHPAITQLLAIRDDLEVLSARSLNGVDRLVAACELLRLFDAVDASDIRSSSLRAIADRLTADVASRCDALRSAIAAATAPDGELTRLVHTAALRIAIAHEEVPVTETNAVRVLGQSAPLHRVAIARSMARASLAAGVPDLATQPEWRRRPDRLATSCVVLGLDTATLKNSLERLAFEAIIEDIAGTLDHLAETMARSEPVIPHERPAPDVAASGTIRKASWRRLDIDWVTSAVDTGLMNAWSASICEGTMHLEVPLSIALAGNVEANAGAASALHPSRTVPRLADVIQMQLSSTSP